MTVFAFTGHRSNKLFGWNLEHPGYDWLKLKVQQNLIAYKASKCVTGMALGFDQLAAQACIELELPFMAAIPCRDQEKVWTKKSQELYHQILAKASVVVLVSDCPYDESVMQKRNIYMVDTAEAVLACWNGTSGGTGNCIRYIQKKEKPLVIIDPRKFNSD